MGPSNSPFLSQSSAIHLETDHKIASDSTFWVSLSIHLDILKYIKHWSLYSCFCFCFLSPIHYFHNSLEVASGKKNKTKQSTLNIHIYLHEMHTRYLAWTLAFPAVSSLYQFISLTGNRRRLCRWKVNFPADITRQVTSTTGQFYFYFCFKVRWGTPHLPGSLVKKVEFNSFNFIF